MGLPATPWRAKLPQNEVRPRSRATVVRERIIVASAAAGGYASRHGGARALPWTLWGEGRAHTGAQRVPMTCPVACAYQSGAAWTHGSGVRI